MTLAAAGMVAVVNSVVHRTGAGSRGRNSLAIPLTGGAVIGAGAFSFHQRHHRRALDTYRPEAVDLVAILAGSA